MMNTLLNYAGYISLFLMSLQLINELRSLLVPIRSNFFNGQFFTWREVYRFIDRLAKRIKEDNIEYGMVCGTGRGGGILAALLSYKLGLIPVLVLDRKYIIDDSAHTRTSVCIEEAVILDSQFDDLYNKPVLLITPQSDPGITLDHYKEVLIGSDFRGGIDKCAIIASERTMDVDLKYCLQRYRPNTKCRRFPWERKNPDLMDSPIHITRNIVTRTP